ncbi:helix-turn-helix protein [Stackebrandtia albiflava]|uniref:Helix-turn-helix protein n=1 Tax=Stackebrandtia albiflava TaxID=406432 RepID=A0A562UL51_9ACTN|nr:helix-turn-helix transcriptional regulator [Stackebrandtia albiflava]TWJ06339.1 helix-turn-helix protein [Stackebrandtia albiflava]
MIRPPLNAEQLARGRALGDRLRKARGDRSIVDAATASGMSPETLRKIETGRLPSPSYFTVAALCRLYGLSMDRLADDCEPDHGSVA